MTESTIVINEFQLVLSLCGLFATFCIVVWAFGTLLVSQFKEHLGQRFETLDEELQAMDKRLERNEEQGRKIEHEMLRLRAELPSEYVRREDWIRFSGTIDSKLDQVRGFTDQLRTSVATIAAQMSGLLRGDSHER